MSSMHGVFTIIEAGIRESYHQIAELLTVTLLWKTGGQVADGAHVMERIELIERLASLVPRPRYHIVHYFGVLARHEMQSGVRGTLTYALLKRTL